MNLLIESLVWVTTGANFWAWATTIFTIGVIFGWKQNNGMSGFKRSVTTLLPLAGVYFFSSANRVIEYTSVYGVGAQSFNNLISISLITSLYTGGLFVGHNVKEGAIDEAIRESGIPEHERATMKLEVKKAI